MKKLTKLGLIWIILFALGYFIFSSKETIDLGSLGILAFATLLISAYLVVQHGHNSQLKTHGSYPKHIKVTHIHRNPYKEEARETRDTIDAMTGEFTKWSLRKKRR